MKIVLCLAILATSAVWAEEAADRAAIEATVAALNTSPTPSNIFIADFPNAAELQRVRQETSPVIPRRPSDGAVIHTEAGTLVISRAPMGEATWYANLTAGLRRFVTRSVTFVASDTAVVVATYERQSVLLVMKHEGSDWRIASFRVLPEARTR